MKNKRQSGFTLVEILIVVIILGILAAIVIPQFSDASSEARESSLDSNLRAIRSQSELYKAQHNDVYPWDDGTGALDSDAEIIRKMTTKTDVDGAAGGDLGPYMQQVPVNPFWSNADATFAEAAADDIDWVITLATGAVDDGAVGEH